MARRRPDRMASVLRVRKVQEDIAAAERQRAEQAVAAEEARFAARELDLRQPWTDRAVVELAYEAVDRAAATLAATSAVADDRRTDHIAAVQRARAIERLVEHRRAEAAQEELRKAAAVLDDLTTTRYNRKAAST
jgi:flagellar biosynthesis chaperone FliJ